MERPTERRVNRVILIVLAGAVGLLLLGRPAWRAVFPPAKRPSLVAVPPSANEPGNETKTEPRPDSAGATPPEAVASPQPKQYPAVRWQPQLETDVDFRALIHGAIGRQDYERAGSIALRRVLQLTAFGKQVYDRNDLKRSVDLMKDYLRQYPELEKSYEVAEYLYLSMTDLDTKESARRLEDLRRGFPDDTRKSSLCFDLRQAIAERSRDIPSLRTMLEQCLQAGKSPHSITDYVGVFVSMGDVERAKREYRRYQKRYPSLPSPELMFSRMPR